LIAKTLFGGFPESWSNLYRKQRERVQGIQDVDKIPNRVLQDKQVSYASFAIPLDLSVDEWVSLHFPKDLSTEEALDRLEKHESSLRKYNVTE